MRRLKFLDGLRGWGAVFVLLYHVVCNGLPINATFSDLLRLLVPLNGTLAVLVFFVVSGFALSARYLADGDIQSWSKIVLGRYPRLAIPVFAACLIVHFVMVFGLVDPADERLPAFREAFNFSSTVGYLLKFSLFDVFFNYDPLNTYIGPLWTMSVELLGSFMVLLAIVIIGRVTERALVLFGLGSLILWLASTETIAMLALFPFGAALADCYERGWVDAIPKWVSLVLLLTGCLVPIVIPHGVTAWGLFGAVPLILGCIALPITRAWLSGPISAYLGRISFPLYLMHGPILCFVGDPLMRFFGETLPQKILVLLTVIVLSFAAAYAFRPINDFAVALAHRWARFVTSHVFVSPAPARH